MIKVIISPAKKMKVDTDTFRTESLPVYLREAEYLIRYLKELKYEEVKKLWGCSERIALQNFEQLKKMDLTVNLTPAILAYEGLQYQYMAPSVFEDSQLEYIQNHLYILSGLYGVLRPLDGVVPYRLEMQAKVNLPGTKNLYEYWGKKLYQEISPDAHIILNLASKEYSRCIERELDKKICYITCTFGEYQGDRIIEKGTYAKMARGEMVRFMAEKKVEDPEQLKKFTGLGYAFVPDRSDEREFVFVK